MTLNFSFSEASDNKSVTITDTTADWAVGQIAEIYAHRNDGTTLGTITPAILGIAYDAIDILPLFSTGDQADLVYVITPDMLKIDGVSQFESTDNFPDGDMEITYDVIDDHNSDSDQFIDSYFVYGAIEELVLEELLLTNQAALTCESSLHKANIRLLHYSYLISMINSAWTGQVDNLRTALANLQYMVANQTF